MMPLGSDRDETPPRPRSPGWMITFADLMSLLVSFFVLLFATTTVPVVLAVLFGARKVDPKLTAPTANDEPDVWPMPLTLIYPKGVMICAVLSPVPVGAKVTFAWHETP